MNVNRTKTQPEPASVEESISAYYSALSDEDVIEQVEWGEFATREFPSEP